MTGSERTRTAALMVIPGGLAVTTVALLVGRTHSLAAVTVGALGLLGLGVLLGWQQRKGPHLPWAEAQKKVGPGRAVVLWKPTCMYCESLLRSLGKDPRITWVNVWVDQEANAAVRLYNGGDELTPTALVGDRVLRNPSSAELRAALV